MCPVPTCPPIQAHSTIVLPFTACLPLLLIPLFVRLGFYFYLFLILLALAEKQLRQSGRTQCWLMAWSHSKLPDALAFIRGWSLTSVMSSLCDSRGPPLLAGWAVHTWLDCLVVWNHSFYCAPRSQSACLDGAQILSAPQPTQPLG